MLTLGFEVKSPVTSPHYQLPLANYNEGDTDVGMTEAANINRVIVDSQYIHVNHGTTNKPTIK